LNNKKRITSPCTTKANLVFLKAHEDPEVIQKHALRWLSVEFLDGAAFSDIRQSVVS